MRSEDFRGDTGERGTGRELACDSARLVTPLPVEIERLVTPAQAGVQPTDRSGFPLRGNDEVRARHVLPSSRMILSLGDARQQCIHRSPDALALSMAGFHGMTEMDAAIDA